MNNQLSIDVNFKSIMRFSVPNIALMIFLSLYVMIDGIFVSTLVGAQALFSLNIVYPIITVAMAIGLMYGAGASAVCAIKLGQDRREEASEDFTAIVILSAICGILFSLLCLFNVESIIYMLGGTEEIYNMCYEYYIPSAISLTSFILQAVFQFMLVTAGEPKNALILTIIGGLSNIVLDYIFIAIFKMGLMGAAIATGLGSTLSVLYGLYCFWKLSHLQLKFVRPVFRGRTVFTTCTNGSSEMVTNLSHAFTNFLFNITIMEIAGTNGGAAITIVLYSQFLFSAVYMGYSSGIAPLFSYNYGQRNDAKLKALFKISVRFLVALQVIIFIASEVFAPYVATIFAKNAPEAMALATYGIRVFAPAFLFSGINMFASSLFTAFSNGKISALISFLRTFVFIVGALVILPEHLDVTGVFLAVPIAEVLSLIFAVFFLFKYKSIYNYG